MPPCPALFMGRVTLCRSTRSYVMFTLPCLAHSCTWQPLTTRRKEGVYDRLRVCAVQGPRCHFALIRAEHTLSSDSRSITQPTCVSDLRSPSPRPVLARMASSLSFGYASHRFCPMFPRSMPGARVPSIVHHDHPRTAGRESHRCIVATNFLWAYSAQGPLPFHICDILVRSVVDGAAVHRRSSTESRPASAQGRPALDILLAPGERLRRRVASDGAMGLTGSL